MASFREDTSEMTAFDDDVSAIIGEYSIPNLADFTSESLLTKSQYAKVIFHDLLPCYPTDADICCRYSLTDDIKSRHGDRIALYRVGWVSVHDHVQFEVTPVTNNADEKEFRVLFKAEVLPKDTTEFYQLCYVNVDDAVCGASVPFQFRHPVDGELCEVEQGGLLVVRSTTAISEEKLRDAAKMIDELECEKLAHEEKIQVLESTKDSLSLKVEELGTIQQREAQLQQDIQKLENEKTQAFTNLKQADIRIQTLNAKVDSLNRDNCTLNELLKSESHKIMSDELSRYRVQVDNMQQMLDALAQSKDLASQALQCEQSKVMTLNIEHDKYKFRSQQLDEENKGLRLDLQQKRMLIETLETRLKQNELLLQSKFKENEATLGKLQQVIKQIGLLQFELNQVNEKCDCLQLQLTQRDNQIRMLDMESKDMQKKGDCLEQLNEEYANLKRQLQDYDGVHDKVKNLKRDNAILRKEIERLKEEVSELQKCKEERDHLSSEFELLTANHVALQNEFYTSSMNSTTIQELQDENVSLRSRLQLASTLETSNSQSASSIEQLKSLLSAAEVSNASLMHELKQIKELQPDWIVDRHRSGRSQHTMAGESSGGCVQSTTTCRVPVTNVELKQMYKSLKDDREKLEAELEDVTTKESNFIARADSKTNRLTEIEHDVVTAKSQLQLAVTKSQQAQEDLVLLNNRMVSIQQQILRDDQKEGTDFFESGDQERLERMSKRCHDLQCCFSDSTTEIHDLQQNIQVLDQERVSIDEELHQKPWVEKKFAEDKCKILEKLVDIDQQLLTLREEFTVLDLKKSCQDWSSENIPLESVQLYEVNPANLEANIKTPDNPVFTDQIIYKAKKSYQILSEENTPLESLQVYEVSSANPEANVNTPDNAVFTEQRFYKVKKPYQTLSAENIPLENLQLYEVSSPNLKANVKMPDNAMFTEQIIYEAKKPCQILSAENIPLENLHLSSANLKANVKMPDNAAFTQQTIYRANSDIMAYALSVSLAQENGFEKISCHEPMEKAVESGVLEGVKHGINTLKEQASKQLNPNSVNSSTESITSVEQKCILANEECREQEKVLQENLAAALKKTVRIELLSSTHDLDLTKDVKVETNAEMAIGMSEVEANLKMRLEMAAEEYRKLYMQKLKVEKQLAKMQQKQVASASPQPPSSVCTEENNGFVCPICGAGFLATNRDSFTRHYEDHLF